MIDTTSNKWLRPTSVGIFLVVLIITAYFRLNAIAEPNFSQDETTILEFTLGLLEHGEPSLIRGESIVPMATYELVPYFIAASVWIFDWTEFAVRLPALIFHLATLVLLFLVALRLFNEYAALLAALLYVVVPWSAYWSTNCFYPSQAQFFCFASTIAFYKLTEHEHPPCYWFYLFAALFSLTYLSWEAAGLILVVYAAMALLLRGSRVFMLLMRPHLWVAGSMMLLVLILQMMRRSLARDSYLFIGSSRAEIASPQLAFLQPSFNPYYYLENIFLTEQFFVLTAIFLLGLLFSFCHQRLRFFAIFTLFGTLAFTLFLAVQGVRYLYIILPTFILTVAVANQSLAQWLFQHDRNTPKEIKVVLATLCLTTLASLQVATASNAVLPLYFPTQHVLTDGPWEMNPETESVDYRSTALFLKAHIREGDIVITSRGGFPLHLYAGIRADYSLQEISSSILVFEPERNIPFYSDKWVGSAVLQGVTQLEDVLHRHPRVWLYAAPTGVALSTYSDELADYIENNMSLVSSSHNARLYLKDYPI